MDPADLIGPAIMVIGIGWLMSQFPKKPTLDGVGNAIKNTVTNNTIGNPGAPAPGNGVPAGTSVALTRDTYTPRNIADGQPLNMTWVVNHKGPFGVLWVGIRGVQPQTGAEIFNFVTGFQVNDDSDYTPYTINGGTDQIVHKGGLLTFAPVMASVAIWIMDGNGKILDSWSAYGAVIN